MKQGELTKSKIIKTAEQLFYKNGYHQTAFSDIVKALNLSKGNITYHYSTKEDILKAVFALRKEQIEDVLLNINEEFQSAQERLHAFINYLKLSGNNIVKYGCPNGSIAYELGKDNSEIRNLSIQIFNILIQWLTQQFSQLVKNEIEAKSKAIELLTRAQGICLISQVYNDNEMFDEEIRKLSESLI